MPAAAPDPHPLPAELLTVKQVAELLNISPRTIWVLAEQKRLPPVRIRGCTRWRRADVVDYVERLAAGEAGHA